MEDSFGINNVALVDGQPRTLGLKELLRTYVEFRIGVVRRRTEYRLRKRKDRLHLVEGLLVAILDIDEVIQLIRASDDTAMAKARLISVFDLSDAQADYILELQLRRLTRFSRIELETERDELRRQIEELEAILADEKLLHRTVSTELADVAKAHGTPRRTVLLESAGTPASVATPLEVTDDPCWVLLSSTGLLARTSTADPVPSEGGRAKHDAVIGAVRTTARGEFALVTSRGRMVRMSALELPTLPPLGGSPEPVRGRAARRLRRPAGRRGARHDRAARRRRPGHRARHRAGHRQAGHHRLPRPARLGGRGAARRRHRGRARPRCTTATRTSSSSPATPSCCASRPRPCGRRAARPAGWPASGSPPAPRSPSSGRSTRAPTTSSSPRPAPPTPCPAPSPARSR